MLKPLKRDRPQHDNHEQQARQVEAAHQERERFERFDPVRPIVNAIAPPAPIGASIINAFIIRKKTCERS